MKTILSREHRKILETTVAQARVATEAGAAKALQALAVGAKEAPAHASEAQKKQRVRLRAHGRALGDVFLPSPSGGGAGGEGEQATKAQTIANLVIEIAYEHWHRMLFARFLAEICLLMHPDGYPVSLADCKEDADRLDPPARSEWEVAGRYASAMLPNVFRPDSPALALQLPLQLPLETEQALEALLARPPVTVFQADDSLGWSYQFWQAPKKEEVQRQMKQAGTKEGADELPAVTQLFTEQYMVALLLENALGGWWHSRHPRMKLPVEMPYLRFTPSPLVGEGRGEGGARRRHLPGLARHARPVQAARPLRRFRPLPRLGLPLPGADAPCHRKALGARCHRPRARRQPAWPRTRCALRRNRRLRAGPGRLAISRP